MRIGHQDPWLSRQLTHFGPVARAVLRLQGPGATWSTGKKQAIPCAENFFFLGVELDSVCMTARLMDERAQSVLDCLSSFKGRTVVLLKQSQRLLGHMASAVTPLGLLHMRPLQHWLHSQVWRWAVRRGTLRVTIAHSCRRSFSSWTDLGFLRAGVPLEYLRAVVLKLFTPSTTSENIWLSKYHHYDQH